MSKPLLRRLADKRVFDIFQLENGRFRVMEMCDQYFYEDLGPEELRQLAGEILALIGE